MNGHQEAIALLTAEVERLTKERDAYRKAKAENDERYLCGQEEARRERDAALAQLAEHKVRADYAEGELSDAFEMPRTIGPARGEAARIVRGLRAMLAAEKARADEARKLAETVRESLDRRDNEYHAERAAREKAEAALGQRCDTGPVHPSIASGIAERDHAIAEAARSCPDTIRIAAEWFHDGCEVYEADMLRLLSAVEANK